MIKFMQGGDIMVRKICPKCASVAWKNSDEKCRFCESFLIKLTFSQSLKLNSIKNTEEKALYITQDILNNKVDPVCIKIRDEKINKAKIEYDKYIKQQKAENEKKQREKIQAYQSQYLEFLEEAQNQNIPESRAREIATYAMHHNLYSLPKCPNCGSVDTSKIGTGTKVAKTAAFGVVGAMSDAGKTWKCCKCGCKW